MKLIGMFRAASQWTKRVRMRFKDSARALSKKFAATTLISWDCRCVCCTRWFVSWPNEARTGMSALHNRLEDLIQPFGQLFRKISRRIHAANGRGNTPLLVDNYH